MALLLVLCGLPASLALARQSGGGAPARRVTTVEALRQFPGFYHLQNVLVRGEFGENGTTIVLRADEREVRAVVADGVRTITGTAEVRGQLIDVGRLDPGDPRIPPAILELLIVAGTPLS